jgi:hypothetical protein
MTARPDNPGKVKDHEQRHRADHSDHEVATPNL